MEVRHAVPASRGDGVSDLRCSPAAAAPDASPRRRDGVMTRDQNAAQADP